MLTMSLLWGKHEAAKVLTSGSEGLLNLVNNTHVGGPACQPSTTIHVRTLYCSIAPKTYALVFAQNGSRSRSALGFPEVKTRDSERYYVLTACMHSFHRQCLLSNIYQEAWQAPNIPHRAS